MAVAASGSDVERLFGGSRNKVRGAAGKSQLPWWGSNDVLPLTLGRVHVQQC